MTTRQTVLALLSLSVIGVGALAFLGSKGSLPPALAGAYERSRLWRPRPRRRSRLPARAPTVPTRVTAEPPSSTGRRRPPPSRVAQLGAPLVHGKFVSDCGAPDTMKVVVKVTVKQGHAVAVAVTTDPTNAAVAACVEKATREKQWDVSPRSQQLTVTY